MTYTEKERIKLWVAALRSGKYIQTYWRYKLDNSFCPLGVLFDTLGPNLWGRSSLTDEFTWGIWEPEQLVMVAAALTGIPSSALYRLLVMNDTTDTTFNEFAEMIEEMVASIEKGDVAVATPKEGQ